MAEEDDILEKEADTLAEAVGGDDLGDDGDGELDPLAEEMLKMMDKDRGDGDGMGGEEDVDRMMEMEMLKAMEEEGGDGSGGGGMGALDMGGAAAAPGGGMSPSVMRLMEVPLTVTIELGRTRMILQDVMDLGEQSLVELEKALGEPVDVMVNGKLFARGEVVTVSENFGVRITELVAPVAAL